MPPPPSQVRAANLGRAGGARIRSSILRDVTHADLIQYGLIPEFVGRLPVLAPLQVCVRGVGGGGGGEGGGPACVGSSAPVGGGVGEGGRACLCWRRLCRQGVLGGVRGERCVCGGG